jgi:hypothetical protein
MMRTATALVLGLLAGPLLPSTRVDCSPVTRIQSVSNLAAQ